MEVRYARSRKRAVASGSPLLEARQELGEPCRLRRVALDPEAPLFAWRERMLDAHGGLARKAKGYPVA
ncbi:hypothetical protein JQX13_46785 [Archangium violaceum]|uniref:hypothetical protein n=1 Tax=Archangium violaceum TaxID=83451 RepID=UPI00193BC280|nr:hypothetical protein [Archangium violaceum]QRK07447.1 hypothetical protein JQX13_46785 [Archangium violaceum]